MQQKMTVKCNRNMSLLENNSYLEFYGQAKMCECVNL